MQVQLLDTGYFKLDGGAMFGVVPKPIWHKLNPADERNRCTWAKRCLLVEQGKQLCLVDTGMGDKQDEKFFGHYDLHGGSSLLGALRAAGYEKEEVTDVFLTHLHFDHVGGAVAWNDTKTAYVPTFPKAKYWTNEAHYQWAIEPNPREKASFLKENMVPLQEHGQLHFVEKGGDLADLPFSELFYADGHTEQQMLPIIEHRGQRLAFVADLFPSVHHIKLPYVMAYDVRPLLTMDEKAQFLEKALRENLILVFQHDKDHEAAIVEERDGRVVVAASGPLAGFLA